MFFKHKRDSLHKASCFFPITNKNSHSFQPRTLQRKGVRMIYDTTMVIEWTKNHLSYRPGGIFSNQVGIRIYIWFGILSNLPPPLQTRNRDNSPAISKWDQIPTDPKCSTGPEKLDPSKGSALSFVACTTMYYCTQLLMNQLRRCLLIRNYHHLLWHLIVRLTFITHERTNDDEAMIPTASVN